MAVFSAIKERKAPRVIDLTPDMFQDEWPDKPREPVKAGLRLISEQDIDTAKAQAAARAIEFHGRPEVDESPLTFDERIAAYNDALMTWAIATSLCFVDDCTRPYFDSPFENVLLAFTPDGIRAIYEQLEILHIERSPLVDEIEADGIGELMARLAGGELDTMAQGPKQRRVRRLLTHVLNELR